MAGAPYDGLLVIDKPRGLTSRDVVDRAQRWFPRGTRVGHTGTLDPLATGVLVLCVGRATRLAEFVQDMKKVYRAGLRLGARSDTDDAEGAVTRVEVSRPPSRTEIEIALRGFIGEIEQVPPAYSAAKVAGRRAYDLARCGEAVSLKPRRVRIDRIDVLAEAYPRLELEIHCGKGTYIRSLARDLGNRLGCGALIETLRRVRVGVFEAANALPLEADAASARAALLPLSAALADLPRVVLTDPEAARLVRGQSLPLAAFKIEPSATNGDRAAAFDRNGSLIALVDVDRSTGFLRPGKVFTPSR
jgi:tRNA pseudouridine55 synthase